MIVSQSLAQRMFPNQDAVNRHLMWTDPVLKFIDISPAPLRIVGVSADVDDENVVPVRALTVYHPFGQEELWGGRLFIHTHMDPYALVSPATGIIRAHVAGTAGGEGRHAGRHPRRSAHAGPAEHHGIRRLRGGGAG